MLLKLKRSEKTFQDYEPISLSMLANLSILFGIFGANFIDQLIQDALKNYRQNY